MQRSKIKIGAEYASARYRDWAEHPGHPVRVQVLDVGAWRIVAHWQATNDETDPDIVPEPHRPARETLTVPKRYRRGAPSWGSRGLGNLVLVREWVKATDSAPAHWGDPTVVETRMLVTTWEDAEDQMQKVRDRKAEERKARNAEDARLREREGRTNERLRDLGIMTEHRVTRSRFDHNVDVLTIRADTLDTLLGLAEAGHAAQREADEQRLRERDTEARLFLDT